jgi:hypothetical protein
MNVGTTNFKSHIVRIAGGITACVEKTLTKIARRPMTDECKGASLEELGAKSKK